MPNDTSAVGNGYTCPSCRMWIFHGTIHSCNLWPPPSNAGLASPTTWGFQYDPQVAIELKRIADALEKLLELKRKTE
jgi:hypothetical protein